MHCIMHHAHFPFTEKRLAIYHVTVRYKMICKAFKYAFYAVNVNYKQGVSGVLTTS